MRLLGRLGLKTQSTMLALAHPSVSGMASGSGTSGSTGWNNASRARLYFQTDKDSDDDVHILQVMKANYGPPNLRTKVRWQRGVYVPVTEAAQEAKEKYSAEAAEECFLRLLDAYTADKRNVSANPSVTYAPTVFANDNRSGKVTKPALVTAMNALFANGTIVNEEFGRASKLRNRIVRKGKPT
jgi:RecA-family ATPase